MKWNEFIKIPRVSDSYQTRIKTNIECPKCGALIWKRLDITLTSIPPQNQYECDNCGWVGYN